MIGTAGGARTPLRGRYLVRHPLWNAALRLADAASLLVPIPRVSDAARPRRVLVALGGHLGDAVIATSVLPRLRAALPDAEIGVLAPSWSAVVFRGHPDVQRVHTVDHWKTSRTGAPLGARWRAYRATAAAAVREMREARYDLALDLYPYYPNAALLLWRSGIPRRVGFVSGGLGRLYTTALPWTDGGRHTAERHDEILRAAGLPAVGEPAYGIAAPRAEATERVRSVLAASGIGDSYVVVHPGAGDPRKEWSDVHWQAVLGTLRADGVDVVLTGAGERERARTARLAAAVPGVADLCGQLDWEALHALVAGARVVLAVDTVTAHLAAAAGRPVVVLMAAMSDPAHWRPLGTSTRVLTAPVACAPCFRSAGCAGMSCIGEVAPAAVLAATREWIEERSIAN